MNDIFKMAEQAYHALSIAESELKRLYKENAELRQALAQPVDAVNISAERVDETAKGGHRGEEHVSDDMIAELERENNMLRARNERQEKEIKWLETQVNNLQIEVLNLRNKKDNA